MFNNKNRMYKKYSRTAKLHNFFNLFFILRGIAVSCALTTEGLIFTMLTMRKTFKSIVFLNRAFRREGRTRMLFFAVNFNHMSDNLFFSFDTVHG